MFSDSQKALINMFMYKLENTYEIDRETIDSLWKDAISDQKERDIVESKLTQKDMVDKQRTLFTNFAKRFIEKKYREKIISYIFHIHPDDRWAFMEKIKNKKKLSDRRPYIESLFDLDEKLDELDAEVYGKDVEKENDKIRRQIDLYDYQKDTKSKSLIYQAFIKKIEAQPVSNRESIYIYFTGIGCIGKNQKERPKETRDRVFNGFFQYLDSMNDAERFIDLLFHPPFDIYKFMD